MLGFTAADWLSSLRPLLLEEKPDTLNTQYILLIPGVLMFQMSLLNVLSIGGAKIGVVDGSIHARSWGQAPTRENISSLSSRVLQEGSSSPQGNFWSWLTMFWFLILADLGFAGCIYIAKLFQCY